MKIYLSNDQSQFYDIPAMIEKLNLQYRLKLAAKKFGFFFILAIVTAFIPVLHFFLVPLFLILSLIMGYHEFGIKYRIDLTLSPDCLQCKKLMQQFYLINDEHKFKCEHCSANYIIELT